MLSQTPSDASISEKIIEYTMSLVINSSDVQLQAQELRDITKLSPVDRANSLLKLYLEVEQYLTEQDPNRLYSREQLRNLIKQHFNVLIPQDKLTMLFVEQTRQKIKLIELIVEQILQSAATLLSKEGIVGLLKEVTLGTVLEGAVFEGIFIFPDQTTVYQLPEEKLGLVIIDLQKILTQLFAKVNDFQGVEKSREIFEAAYYAIKNSYAFLDLFSQICLIMPEGILEKEKIAYLTKKEG